MAEENIVQIIPLQDITGFQVHELFGSASLNYNGEKDKTIAYVSNAKLQELRDFVQKLNHWLRTEQLPSELMTHISLCPSCNNPLPEPDAKCPICAPKLNLIRRLFALLGPYRWRLYLVMALTFIAVAAQIAPPYITKHIVDDVIVAKNAQQLGLWIVLMVISGLTFLIARWLIGSISVWLSTRLIAELRQRLHAHLQSVTLDYFNKRSSGELISRVMQDTTEIQQFIIEGLPFLLVNGVSLILISIVLLSMDASLALIVFVPVPILAIVTRYLWRRIYPMIVQRNSYRGRLNSILAESIIGVKAIKAANREQSRNQEFQKANMRFFHSVNGIMRRFIGFNEFSFWLMSLAVVLVWWAGATRLGRSDPSLSLGVLLAFVGYIWLFFGPLQWFGVIVNWMNNALAGADRIFTLLDAETEPEIKERQTLRFNDVSFSYDTGKPALKNVNLEIKPGEMIGLVGRSGAGKSTLINLLCRYYQAQSGTIEVDNRPIETYRLGDLRSHIGIVMQDPFIFNASILENIRYCKPDAAFEAVIAAAKAAHAHEFIVDKPAAYDTIIGENGVQLSGGERQRIAIARAILQDPDLLILDEATSLVDVETEKEIQEAMEKLVKGRTTIAIAHRLATLRNAHRLIVMDEGQIAEQGTHEELRANENGIYAKLLKAQAELNAMRNQASIA